jgi:hypothetical protein
LIFKAGAELCPRPPIVATIAVVLSVVSNRYLIPFEPCGVRIGVAADTGDEAGVCGGFAHHYPDRGQRNAKSGRISPRYTARRWFNRIFSLLVRRLGRVVQGLYERWKTPTYHCSGGKCCGASGVEVRCFKTRNAA